MILLITIVRQHQKIIYNSETAVASKPPCIVLVDVLSLTIPSSALKKKHQACNYHKARESIAAGFIRYSHIRSEENVDDLLTKLLVCAVSERLCA